jgi:hypothetical protein
MKSRTDLEKDMMTNDDVAKRDVYRVVTVSEGNNDEGAMR